MTLPELQQNAKRTREQIASLEYEGRQVTAGLQNAREQKAGTEAGALEVRTNLRYLQQQAKVVSLSDWDSIASTLENYRILLAECDREEKRRIQQLEKIQKQLGELIPTLRKLEKQIESCGALVEMRPTDEHRRDPTEN